MILTEVSVAKLTAIENEMTNLKVCYELTPEELKNCWENSANSCFLFFNLFHNHTVKQRSKFHV